MGLALGVHPGDVIHVGSVPVKVLGLSGYEAAVLVVGAKRIRVTDKSAEEVLPGVMVSCGRPSVTRIEKNARLVQSAHREWTQRQDALERGELTLEEYEQLPRLILPPDCLPRLLFEAPRDIKILREELGPWDDERSPLLRA